MSKSKSKRSSNRKSKRSLRPETLESRQLMTADCIDFEDLTLGKQYLHGDSFIADDTGFQAEISLEDFTWSSGGTTSAGYAEVQNGLLAGGSGQELQVNNTLLRFDFAEPVSGLSVKYGEYGGNLNLEINGDFHVFEDFTDIGSGTPIPSLGGVDIFVNDDPSSDLGEVKLVGIVEQLKIGGQELWIDDVCLSDSDREPRFDFGDAPDSYGTTLANFGPAHLVVPDVHLGRTVDPELNGQPSPNANRDDANGTIDDEDGVTFTSAIVAGQNASVEVIASTDGWLNAWADFNQDGQWTINEKIFDQPINAGVNALNFAVPARSVTNEMTFTRWRFSNTHKSLEPTTIQDEPDLRRPNGEVEDHPIVIRDGQPDRRLDFGDAPDSYRTTLASLGPSHRIVQGIHLGDGVDAEPDGQPSPNAMRDDLASSDDEDGVKFITPLVAGHMADVEVVASVDGWLNAWVDFNQDGTWAPGEKIFSAQPLVAGANVLSFAVPDDSVTNEMTHSRWRFSTEAMNLPFHGGPAGADSVNGEVEDHALRFQDPPQQRLDYGDAPDSYRTTLASLGPSHRIVQGIHLGDGVDAEPDGQPSPNAMRDDLTSSDDEDGVKFITPLVAGHMADVEVVASVDGWLNAWVDFNQDGTWAPGEKIFSAQPLVAGANVLSFAVPDDSVTNEMTHSRWRFSTEAMNLPFHGGPAGADSVNGEVEDHALRFQDPPQQRLDYGDAPKSYRTLLADNGARHRIDPDFYLGSSIDAEPDGQPSLGAVRDDLNTIDDEDGVRFLTPLLPGTDAKVEVTASEDGWLNAWVDFDRNGSWDPATEAIATAEFIPIGTTILTFVVPEIDDVDHNSLAYSRFRFSSDTQFLNPWGVRADGTLPNGEVEDYAYLNGDLDGDLDRDIDDVNIMSKAIKNGTGGLTDLNYDGTTDQSDMDILIEKIFGTHRGDADLDGDVDFADFLTQSATSATSSMDRSGCRLRARWRQAGSRRCSPAAVAAVRVLRRPCRSRLLSRCSRSSMSAIVRPICLPNARSCSSSCCCSSLSSFELASEIVASRLVSGSRRSRMISGVDSCRVPVSGGVGTCGSCDSSSRAPHAGSFNVASSVSRSSAMPNATNMTAATSSASVTPASCTSMPSCAAEARTSSANAAANDVASAVVNVRRWQRASWVRCGATASSETAATIAVVSDPQTDAAIMPAPRVV